MAIKIGDRYLPKRTVINDKLKLSNNSVTTVCFVDSINISIHIDSVPGFNTIQAVMPLGVFSANFIENPSLHNTTSDFAKAYAVSKHFIKLYPDYFLKIIS